ncbi:hypothetical protein R3X28_02290 [Maribacter sp. TH_r10]|nr:hypothetical protein [Maribacter sp. TH_r10]MDV7137682.1 hypothetical protein [Maribacter sp. TH_r10]
MKEEVIGTKEVFKSCFAIGCLAVIIFIALAVGIFLWPYSIEG